MKKLLVIPILLGMINYSYAESSEDLLLKRENISKEYKNLKKKSVGSKVRVVARFKGDLNKEKNFKSSMNSKLKKHGLKYKKIFRNINAASFELDSSELDALLDSNIVEYIQEDIAVPPYLAGSIAQIDADIAQLNGFDGDGQAVVIIDTGVELTHPFLAGRIVEEACFSTNSSDASSLCPGGVEQATGAGSGGDCSATGISSCDHGTHVAGIAAGNNATLSGVAPAANIISIQAFSEFSSSYSGCNGSACILSYTSDQLAALDWVLNDATTNNIAAINMSLGGGEYFSSCDSDIRRQVIIDLAAQGISTVISSGNDGYTNAVGAPGCIKEAITVGSVNWNNSISSYSNSANMVDIVAPGSSISSSVTGGGFSSKSGTSMAAPHVTGAIAVLRNNNDFPNESIDNSIQRLLWASTSVATDTRNGVSISRPSLNVNDAVTYNLHSELQDKGVSISNKYSNWYEAGSRTHAIDYNGDGREDMLLGPSSGGEWYLLRNDGGSFSDMGAVVYNKYSNWYKAGDRIHVLDYNEDGLDDIILGPSGGGEWYALRNNGGSFTDVGAIITNKYSNWSSAGTRVKVIDYNNDGRDDILMGPSGSGHWYVMRNDSGSGFSDMGAIVTSKYANWASSGGSRIKVIDYNDDGRDDIILGPHSSGNWYALRNNGSSFVDEGSIINSEYSEWYEAGDKIHIIDINNDSRDDILLGPKSNGDWYVLRNDSGVFTGLGAVLEGAYSNWSDGGTRIRVMDNDGDGDDDIFIGPSSSGTWYALENQ